ncbi:MAG: Holliday junction resolvase RuvX [Bacilli bacterium]
MNRVLGIDYGDSKVGFAVNDELNILATPLATLFYKGDKDMLFAEIDKYVTKYDIKVFVVGMPLNMNNTKGERVAKTEQFIASLKEKYINISIKTVDERLTTRNSNNIMNQMNIKSAKKKKIEDTMAAISILQLYIDMNNK